MYCSKCLKEGKHNHFPLHEIVDFIENLDHEWHSLHEKYKTCLKEAKERYSKLDPLIKYFEAEVIDSPIEEEKFLITRRCISADLNKLTSTFGDLSKHLEKIDVINLDG